MITRTTPDAALIQNPAHITGKNLFIGCRGRLGEKPRTRKSIAMLVPTRNPRPTVCRKSTVGYAHTDGDSFIQVLKPLCSSEDRKSMVFITDRKMQKRKPKRRPRSASTNRRSRHPPRSTC